ncbi:low molecular weight protein tyrosine phosphatase family protein [Cerasicoccus arenae]|uniref:Phosphotyrosine protein phosphatase n=1 Tax=Cerasicoccus arenae TaxID=424488 RepID=A0A8J3DEC6_9BACT|nr:protein tyrosine phosphatase [Cerasicoccus arenae]MBK1858505.1 hypothetical protein [Cerasicoccus arenae]GHC10210.1 phosphotyrosine protein phosphatase [Cerasicoccus arenae]
MKPRLLFVCSRNQWRSPTAEEIYRPDARLEVRSAGVSGSARHTISQADIDWADLILVMVPTHKRRIIECFHDSELPPIESLDIPDDYQPMDAELIDLIQAATEPLLIRLLS